MVYERPNALDLLSDLGRRIGLRLDCVLGRSDPVEELSPCLFPSSPCKSQVRVVTLNRSLVWPFTPHFGVRLPEQEVYSHGLYGCRSSSKFLHD